VLQTAESKDHTELEEQEMRYDSKTCRLLVTCALKTIHNGSPFPAASVNTTARNLFISLYFEACHIHENIDISMYPTTERKTQHLLPPIPIQDL
jgi:hypothetical protein